MSHAAKHFFPPFFLAFLLTCFPKSSAESTPADPVICLAPLWAACPSLLSACGQYMRTVFGLM
jgi:hypothetical protein